MVSCLAMQVSAGGAARSAGRDGTGGRENWEGADTGRSWLGGLPSVAGRGNGADLGGLTVAGDSGGLGRTLQPARRLAAWIRPTRGPEGMLVQRERRGLSARVPAQAGAVQGTRSLPLGTNAAARNAGQDGQGRWRRAELPGSRCAVGERAASTRPRKHADR
jgi:hypothetical protein